MQKVWGLVWWIFLVLQEPPQKSKIGKNDPRLGVLSPICMLLRSKELRRNMKMT